MIAKPAEHSFIKYSSQAECRGNLQFHPKINFINMGAYDSH